MIFDMSVKNIHGKRRIFLINSSTNIHIKKEYSWMLTYDTKKQVNVEQTQIRAKTVRLLKKDIGGNASQHWIEQFF
jgi:hypothetical protein